MSVEQPPKIICEICGGAHATSSHVSVAEEEQQDQEPTQEKEPNHEAMKKVVDLFTTEDLKFRDLFIASPESVITTLETGVPTALTSFLYEPFGRLDKTTRNRIAELRATRKLEQEAMPPGLYTGDERYYDKDKFRQTANVYYPDGLLKALRDKLSGTTEVGIYGKNVDTDENTDRIFGSRTIESGGMVELGRAYFSLTPEEREKIANLIGLTEVEISTGLKNWLEGTISEKEEIIKQKFLKELLNNSQAWAMIRTAWMKIFLNVDKNNSDRRSSGIVDSDSGERIDIKNVHQGYVYEKASLGFGLVLSPDTKVAISPHSDFPEQATIMEPRVKPRDIVGLFIDESNLKKFNEKHFSRSQALSYLLDKFNRPFFYYLAKQGFSEHKLQSYQTLFTSCYNLHAPERNLRVNLTYDRNLRIAENINASVQSTLGKEEYDVLMVFVDKFIEEYSPIKYSETHWDGLQRLAEQHQLPIYKPTGEILWPKHMTHDEVAKFVAEKSEEEKTQSGVGGAQFTP